DERNAIIINIINKNWLELLKVKLLKKDKTVLEGENYFVGVDGIFSEGYNKDFFQNLNIALTLALTKGILAYEKHFDPKGETDKYKILFDTILSGMKKFYLEMYGKSKEFNEQCLEYMISEDLMTKICIEMEFAVPTIKFATKSLRDLYEKLQIFEVQA
ncbi:MAG: hypothetical protein ABH883_02760, partial [Candidatus Omnitrophota bacterium]